MTDNEIKRSMISAREEYINIIKSELLGPGSEFSLPDAEHELISSTPTSRYSVGILFPQGNEVNQDNDETVELEEADNSAEITDSASAEEPIADPVQQKKQSTYAFDETADENLDEEIGMATQYMPSSMGITFIASGNTNIVRGSLTFATYRNAKIPDCMIPYWPDDPDTYTVPPELAHIVAYDKEVHALRLISSVTAKEARSIFERDTISEKEFNILKKIIYRFVDYCAMGYVRVPHEIPEFVLDFSHGDYDDCMTIISDEDPEEKIATITRRLPKWVDKIALEIGAPHAEVEKILTQKWLDPVPEGVDVTGIQYRVDEYTALSGEVGAVGSGLGDFSREEMDISEYGLPHIKAISLIDKVRVVNALIGFSRIQPAMTRNDVGFVDVKDPDTRWYPAYEVRGEGIFIEFNQEDIDNWVETHTAVNERAAILNRNYATSFIGKNHPRTITPKFLMLHTLSHLLISQLSFECGYSIASLSERLYCAEESDGKNMAGIFIYTASGDAEGTLGGLVRQGRPDAFPGILRKAIANAKTCSNDPVCIMSRGQGRDSLNLAACHACGLLPETCCEERNAFLDRGVIVGTYENPEIGFWNDIG